MGEEWEKVNKKKWKEWECEKESLAQKLPKKNENERMMGEESVEVKEEDNGSKKRQEGVKMQQECGVWSVKEERIVKEEEWDKMLKMGGGGPEWKIMEKLERWKAEGRWKK